MPVPCLCLLKCDADSGNITAQSIAAVLTPRTKAIICVHLAGWPCDMDPIMALADQHGLKVIEDCAQAHGARYKGRSVGSIGHVGAWSFCQDKIMTTGGEGGMVTTNDEALWRSMWSFKDHGKSYEAVYERQHPPGFRWVHESFGTNWRMLEMQAAIGRIQLRRMAQWTAARTANAAVLAQALQPFAGPGGVVRLPAFRCGSSCTVGGAGGGICAGDAGCVRRWHAKCMQCGLCARAVQGLCLCAPRKPGRRLEPRPHRARNQRAGCAVLPGQLLRGLP
jgi:dTDP-4-amino-4,6-dideoxygalactose transaminase